jgi:hypothetical protein
MIKRPHFHSHFSTMRCKEGLHQWNDENGIHCWQFTMLTWKFLLSHHHHTQEYLKRRLFGSWSWSCKWREDNIILSIDMKIHQIWFPITKLLLQLDSWLHILDLWSLKSCHFRTVVRIKWWISSISCMWYVHLLNSCINQKGRNKTCVQIVQSPKFAPQIWNPSYLGKHVSTLQMPEAVQLQLSQP